MTQIMTAAGMTDGQIENAVSKLRDAMRKHRSEIPPNVAQQVLGVENLGMVMFVPFRKCAEAISNLIVRKVTVNLSRTSQEAFDATGREQLIDCKVLDSMPKALSAESVIVLFKPDLTERDGHISDDDLEMEFKLRGLKPAGPFSVAAMNEADPAFADKRPHGTHWKDEEGKWCSAAFARYGNERVVAVNHSGACRWHDSWWFAGVPE